ncbi:Putative metal chaperone YciC [bacterium YEK0313]|nr:Putative metal chaperone YciC [bacterium YEK0313]
MSGNAGAGPGAGAAPAFIVLTGFLGSGKTTLLRDFLDLPEAADTAIIVNEAGEIGLDGALLADGGGDVRMSMLANGCVCCQGASDLAVAVEALLRVDRPQAQGPLKRIILETSGLSKPGPVLRSLSVLAEHRMPVSILSTYDAARGATLAAFPEALAQWAGAQALIVTKADLVAADAGDAAVRAAGAVNPLAGRAAGCCWKPSPRPRRTPPVSSLPSPARAKPPPIPISASSWCGPRASRPMRRSPPGLTISRACSASGCSG